MLKPKLPKNLLERLIPVLLFASIGLAFLVGLLWQKVNNLESGGTVAGNAEGRQIQIGEGDGTQEPVQEGPSQGKMSAEQAQNIPEVDSDDHVRGSSNAKVFLIEYSDYECPFCSRFHPTALQVLDDFGDDVAWVYRHFPLDQIHPKARPAALASECVAELGGNDAFWAFTDFIFEDQTTLSDLEGVASKVGVNVSAFNTCVDSDKYADYVESDYQEGITAGVRGTPGNFIVNTKGDAWFVPGAYPYEQIKPFIDEALQS